MGIEDWGEIEYKRGDTLFSTDINARKDFDIMNNLSILVNFVIECKYKDQGHKWFFMKFSEDSDFSTRRDVRNECFDDLFNPLMKNLGYKKKEDKYPLADFRISNLFNLKTADKGVDIYDKGNDPNIISEAISQSVFAQLNLKEKIFNLI